jgi:hypothetical protein
MTVQQRAAMMRDLSARIARAGNKYHDVIVENRLGEKLAPQSSVWEMAIEVLYMASMATTAIMIAKTLAKTRIIRGGIVRRAGTSSGMLTVPDTVEKIGASQLSQDAVKNGVATGIRLARKQLQGAVAGVKGETERTRFMQNLKNLIDQQAQTIYASATTELNDDQRLALVAHFDASNHTVAVYERALQRIINVFETDIAPIGAGAGDTVLLSVIGPTYHLGNGKTKRLDRMGLFRVRPDYDGDLKGYPIAKFPAVRRRAEIGPNFKSSEITRRLEYYRLMSWTTKGFEGIATEKQESINKTSWTHHGVSTIAHDAPWMFDPLGMVAGWIAKDAPKFKPPRLPPRKKQSDMFGGVLGK